MSNQRIITRETPSVWYHKGEVVTDTLDGIVGRPWNSTTSMTIAHDEVEYAELMRNSTAYYPPKTPTQKRNRK